MTPDAAYRLKADLVLVAITAVWGATFVVVKDALDQADPFTFLALRFAVGALVGTALAWRHLRHPNVLRYGAFLGLFLFLGYAFQTVGLLHTTESRSAFITGLAVVLVPLVSILIFKRWPQVPSILGVLVAVGGLYVLTGGLQASTSEETSTFFGDLLTLGCAVSFAFHIALTERFAPRVPPLALVSVQLWVVSILSALTVPLGIIPARLDWSGSFLPAVLFTGVFASTVAIALQTWAQARTTAVRAALVFSLEPVFASAVSVGLGRETLGPREYLGGALLILAILVAEVGNAWLARRSQGSQARGRPT